jgi:ribosomal protein L3 glutamine methyltransferase
MADSPPHEFEVPPGATVLDLIRTGAVAFERAGLCYGHGMANAIDEAAALVFHALDLEHTAGAAAYRLRPEAADVERVLRLLASRVERRVPAAYLMGRMWFADLEFEVDERVIVPRSPFAELIMAGFEPWLRAGEIRRVLDIGTGSACIAIACAKYLEGVTVDAVELSPAALEVARHNVAKHAVGGRVRLLQGDVYGPVADQRYDLIVANPPYVSDSEMSELPAEYRHEPDLALRSGIDGLDVTRRILAGAAQHLENGGALFVEVGDSEERLQQAFPTVPFLWLEFEHGGGGVFMLTREDLARHRHAFCSQA